MRFSRSFTVTQKEVPGEIEAPSHRFMLQSGLIQQVSAGFYDILPLGQRVMNNIERVVREEMNRAGAQEVSMPIMQPADLWEESGRWDVYGKELIRLKDRKEKEYCLGPTHEEIISDLVRPLLLSYRQLPFTLFQVGKKFRDEIRPRHGLLRAKEFLMKDAYSFDKDKEGLDKSYDIMKKAYINIYNRLGLEAISVEADPEEIGGKTSEEFLSPAEFGESQFVIRDGSYIKAEDLDEIPSDAQTAIEVGHIFKLGDDYSRAMQVTYTNENGEENFVEMGCYGIGVSRLMAAIIEQHHDSKGPIWPLEVSPYPVTLLSITQNEHVQDRSQNLYENLQEVGIEVLFDDRNESPGVKFNDADLLGIPHRFIVGPRGVEQGVVEYENRRTKEQTTIPLESVVEQYFEITTQ